MHVLRWELPPWKTFVKERREVLARFEREVAKAHEGVHEKISRAESDALAALRARGRAADATGS
jgi:hypothetical protein